MAGVTVLDASVVVAYLEAEDAHHDRAAEVLAQLAEDDLRASTLTLAEVLVGPIKAGSLDHVQGVLADLGVDEVPLGETAAVRLAQLRAEHRLKLPDCCVLLAAEDVRGRVASFDERLRRAARRGGLGVVSI